MKKKPLGQAFALVSVRMPPAVKAELERLADLDGRSLSNLITRLAIARIRAERQRPVTA